MKLDHERKKNVIDTILYEKTHLLILELRWFHSNWTGRDPSGISQPERNIFMRTCTVLALCIFQLDATGFVYDPKKLRRIKLKPRLSVIIDGLKSPWFQTRLGKKEIGSLFVVRRSSATLCTLCFAIIAIQPISPLRLLRFENKHTTTNNTSLAFILPTYECLTTVVQIALSQQIASEWWYAC